MASFVLRTATHLFALALSGFMAIYPFCISAAESGVSQPISDVGKAANSLGKDLSGSASTNAPTFSNGTLTIKTGEAQSEINQTELAPKSGENESIKYLRTTEDFDQQRVIFKDKAALETKTAEQKNTANTDALLDHSSIEGAVYSIVSELATRQRLDLKSESFLQETQRVLSEVDEQLENIVTCNASASIDKTPEIRHIPDLKYCQQVLDGSSSCTITHNYTATTASGITGDTWSTAECVNAAIAVRDGFATGSVSCTSMPSLDSSGCTTINGVKICSGDLGPSPISSISPLCKKVSVSSTFSFYKGDTGCWQALTGYLADGTPIYQEICGGTNTGGNLDTCSQYRNDSTCTFVSSSCVQGAQGASGTCYAAEIIYDCGPDITVDTIQADTAYDCQGVGCLGEECLKIDRSYSTDFGKLATALSAVQYIALDMSCGSTESGTENLGELCEVFKGSISTCSSSVGGSHDCCGLNVGPGTKEYLQMVLEAVRSRSSTTALREASSRKLSQVTAGTGGLTYEPLGTEIAGQYSAVKGDAATVIQGGVDFLSRPFSSTADNLYGNTDYVSSPANQFKLWAADEMRDHLKGVFADILEQAGYGETAASITPEAKTAADQNIDQAITSLDNGTASVLQTIDEIFIAYQTAVMVSNPENRCSRTDYETVSRREIGSCRFVGSYCKHDSNSKCSTKEQVYCCYDSPLSRILNEQIKVTQGSTLGIGSDWGTPEDPHCGGLQMKDVDRIDWSKINLDEWTALLTLYGGNGSGTSVVSTFSLTREGESSERGLETLTGQGSALDWTGTRGNVIERAEAKLSGQEVDALRQEAQRCISLDLGNGITVRSGCSEAYGSDLECRRNNALVDCDTLAYRNSLAYLLGQELNSDTYWDEGYRCTEGSVSIDCSSLYSQSTYWEALEEYASRLGGSTYLHRYVCVDESRSNTSAFCENAMIQNYCGCAPGNFVCRDGNRLIACSSLGATQNRCDCMDGVCEGECTYGGVPNGLENNADHLCTSATCPYGRSVGGVINCDAAYCPYGT